MIKIRTPLFVSLSSGIVLLLVNALGPTYSAPTAAEDIKYCEEIGDKLGQYSSKEQLFASLTLKAQRKAVQQLLSQELQRFEPQVVSKEIFIDTLLHLVQYTQVSEGSDGLLTPCVVLQQAALETVHKQRFQPLEVGRVCSYDEKLLKKQADSLREEFIDRLFSDKKGEAKPASIMELLAEPDKIAKKHGKALEKLVHQRKVAAAASAIEQSSCVALEVYPIELYSLSVPYRSEDKSNGEKTSALSADDLKLLADQQARWHGLEPRLFRALVEQESGWDTAALSPRGAVGLTQLMPATAREECGLSRLELTDPQQNLACGAHYLSKHLSRFNDVKLALCAYNAGPGVVAKGKCDVYQETTRYTRTIMSSVGS